MPERSPRFARLVGPATAFLAIALLALTALTPFLAGRMPLSADGALHLYRLVSLDHALGDHRLSDGGLWPRYVAGMAYGYGAPMFNYYAPLSLYPAQALRALGASYLDAWLGGMIAWTLVGALGAYALGRAWAGPTGGVVASAAYTYAPYILYDAVARGSTAELAALALLPWALWALWWLAQHGGRANFALVVASFALFIPMHNVVTLHAAPLIALWALLAGLTATPAQRVGRLRALVRLGVALALGAGLVAFFWLPALTETRYIKLDAITANLPFIDVVANLTPLSAILSPPLTADPTQMQPPTPIALGWPQIALAAAGVIVTWTGRHFRPLRPWGLMAAALALVYAFMNTPASAAIWDAVPLIGYSQYPWRLLGPISLLLALLGALAIASLADGSAQTTRRGYGLLGATLAVMLIYAIPWLYARDLPEITPANPASIRDAQAFERASGLIATSSFGEYLPIWNETLPDPLALAERFAAHPDGVIPRLASPPPGVTIRDARWGNTRASLDLAADSPTELTFDWFYFPGWRATLNGTPLEVYPSAPLGLLMTRVPAGEGRLEVALGLSERGALGVGISLMSLLVALLLMAWPPRALATVRAWFVGQASTQPPALSAHRPTRGPLLIAALVGLSVSALKVGVIDRVQSPLRAERFADGDAAGVQTVVDGNFEDIFTLIGFDLPGASVPSGGELGLRAYWRLRGEPVANDLSTVYRLRDPAGLIVAEAVYWQPGGLATRHWRPGEYLQERLALAIPPGTPPGDYALEASLYDPEAGRALSIIDIAGNPTAQQIALAQITVTRPDQPAEIAPDPALVLAVDGLRLLRVEPLAETAVVGGELRLDWTWAAETELSADLAPALVWLRAGDDAPAASTPPLPPVGQYPVQSWMPGDVWRGRARVYAPAALESGDYVLAIQLGDARAIIGAMRVDAPARDFAAPSVQTASDAVWTNGIRLHGYDLARTGEAGGPALTLYWTPEAPLETSLRVFVHLLDADGRIIAQFDRIPLEGARPTTGWLPGESVRDVYAFAAPGVPATALRVGWYDPLTGSRVVLSESPGGAPGDDHLLIPLD